DVPANESRVVLVDVHAPQATAAGKYTGTLHVTGGVTQDVPVELTVWDFDVPSTSTLKTAFGMAWNGPCMGHGDGNCSGGDADMAWTSTTLFAYVCDEPPLTCQWSDIPSRIAAVKAGDPSMPALVTTTPWEEQAQKVSGIDLFVPVINYVEGKAGTNEAGNQRA